HVVAVHAFAGGRTWNRGFCRKIFYLSGSGRVSSGLAGDHRCRYHSYILLLLSLLHPSDLFARTSRRILGLCIPWGPEVCPGTFRGRNALSGPAAHTSAGLDGNGCVECVKVTVNRRGAARSASARET